MSQSEETSTILTASCSPMPERFIGLLLGYRRQRFDLYSVLTKRLAYIFATRIAYLVTFFLDRSCMLHVGAWYCFYLSAWLIIKQNVTVSKQLQWHFTVCLHSVLRKSADVVNQHAQSGASPRLQRHQPSEVQCMNYESLYWLCASQRVTSLAV